MARVATTSSLILCIQTIYCTFHLEHTSIENYHLVSSRVQADFVARRKRENPQPVREFRFTLDLSNDGMLSTVIIKERNCDIVFDSMILASSSHLYEGFVQEVPHNSSVTGYIKEGNFYGHIIVNNTLYYVDEFRESTNLTIDLSKGPIAERNALIFKRDSVTLGVIVSETESAKQLFRDLTGRNYFYRKYNKWKDNGKLCPLVVVIDNSFLTMVHKGNVAAARFHVLFSLEEANSIFRITDFDEDGHPDNIGFYVKKLVIMETNQPTDFILPFSTHERLVTDYLVQFMRYPELRHHCLGIVFTAQKFDRGTLGASYTPDSTSLHPTSGICDSYISGLGTMNGLVITASTSKTPLVNQVIFEVTIAHELGHSFGSSHDSSENCLGYIMSPKSFRDYSSNRSHLMFSPCSRVQIMRTLTMKGDCFDHVNTPFCGNGIVEDGEDCDCGLTRDCLLKDPCCVPRRTTANPCKTNKKRGHQCHPSQGVCCTPSCTYQRHLDGSIVCENFDQQCPCLKSQGLNCNCGINGQCVGDECHSIECLRLGTRECQCNTSFHGDKSCQVCCQMDHKCLPASTLLEVSSNQDEFKYKINERFRAENCNGPKKNQCTSFQFSKFQLGTYCLYKGRLGWCGPDLQCKVLKAKQSFPSFDNASAKSPLELVNTVCYFLLNSFLIYLFY